MMTRDKQQCSNRCKQGMSCPKCDAIRKPVMPHQRDTWELTHQPVGIRLSRGFAMLRGWSR